MRRLGGAALYARAERAIRQELSEDYGLPMGEYVTRSRWADWLAGPDMQPTLGFIFERGNGRTIQVHSIEPNNDGTIATRAGAIEFR